MTAKKEKPAKSKFEGMSLEMDVMKKLAAQLERLQNVAARDRVLAFVQQAVFEKKLDAFKLAETRGPDAGQLGLPNHTVSAGFE